MLDCFAALAMTNLGSALAHAHDRSRTRRSINPKTASIDTPFNLDTSLRAPLGVALRKRFEL
jgi:hypothetical protein